MVLLHAYRLGTVPMFIIRILNNLYNYYFYVLIDKFNSLRKYKSLKHV